MATRDMEKADVLNNFFASIFTGKGSSCSTWFAEGKYKNWKKEDLPVVSEDQAQDHLKDVKVSKSMGPDKIDPQVPRELADKVAKPLSIVLERSWQSSEDPTDWKEKT